MTSPFAESSTGPGEELAVGHVVAPVGGDERAPETFRCRSVPGPSMWISSLPVDPLGEPARLLRLRAPGLDRVVAVAQAGAVEEVLVVGQRHVGLGGVGVRREEGQAPAELARGGAPHHRLHQRLGGRLPARLALRVHAGERARVRRRPSAGCARPPARPPTCAVGEIQSSCASLAYLKNAGGLALHRSARRRQAAAPSRPPRRPRAPAARPADSPWIRQTSPSSTPRE